MHRADEDAKVSADGALLWLLHSLLRDHWLLLHDHNDHQQHNSSALELRCFVGNVSLLPARAYQVDPQRAAVAVRAIRVQHKLFVHFVSANTTLRLDLLVGDFVKPATESDDNDDNDGRVLRVGSWLCNRELLQWRLARNVFAELSLEPPALRMGAELSKLDKPVLARIYVFLRAPDFVRVTQTNKYLHQLAENPSLWSQFLTQEFPGATSSSTVPEITAKLAYIDKQQEKLQRDRARLAMLRLALLWDPSTGRHGRGRADLFSPAQPPFWLPPSPLHPVLPMGGMLDPETRRGTRRTRPDDDLDFDFELRPTFDRRRGEFDGLW